jgi:hypothetical protein
MRPLGYAIDVSRLWFAPDAISMEAYPTFGPLPWFAPPLILWSSVFIGPGS